MTQLRLAQEVAEVLAAGTPKLKAAQTAAEVLAAGTPKVKVAYAAAEALAAGTPKLKAAYAAVEVLVTVSTFDASQLQTAPMTQPVRRREPARPMPPSHDTTGALSTARGYDAGLDGFPWPPDQNDALIVRAAARRLDVAHTFPTSAFGSPTMGDPEAVSADRFTSDVSLPPRRREPPVLTGDRDVDARQLLDEGYIFGPPPDTTLPQRRARRAFITGDRDVDHGHLADAESVVQPAVEMALPPRPRPAPGVTGDADLDRSHLSDAEVVFQPAFDVPLARVVPARSPAPRIPGSEQTLYDLFDPEPVSYLDRPWHVAMSEPARDRRDLAERPQVQDGALVVVPEAAFEFTAVNWHTPLEQPGLRRRPWTPPPPIGGVDLDDAGRAETVFAAAFLVQALPPQVCRRLRAELSGAELALLPDLLLEAVHADALQREDPHVPRRVLQKFMAALQDGGLLEDDGFAPPFIPKVRKAMLAAGFWRARM